MSQNSIFLAKTMILLSKIAFFMVHFAIFLVHLDYFLVHLDYFLVHLDYFLVHSWCIHGASMVHIGGRRGWGIITITIILDMDYGPQDYITITYHLEHSP